MSQRARLLVGVMMLPITTHKKFYNEYNAEFSGAPYGASNEAQRSVLQRIVMQTTTIGN